jgi:hypothetical protein
MSRRPRRGRIGGTERRTIPVGATVTVHGHRNSDAKRLDQTERVTWNGRTFNVYGPCSANRGTILSNSWRGSDSALGAMRESGVWTYGVVNLSISSGSARFRGCTFSTCGCWGFGEMSPSVISEPTVSVASVGFGNAVMSGVVCLRQGDRILRQSILRNFRPLV